MLNVQRVRLACSLRATPRIWTFLSRLRRVPRLLVAMLAEEAEAGFVEGGGLLEEVHVARLGDTNELRARDPRVEIVRGGGRHQDVLRARGDERGHAQRGQAVAGVMAAYGLSLAVQPDEGRLERVLEGSLYPHLDEVAPLREGLPAEEPGQDEEGELLDIAMPLGTEKVVDDRAAPLIDMGGRAVELQAQHAIGVPEGQLLRDHAAHGDAGHMRAAHP